jgi:hypothetical protein
MNIKQTGVAIAMAAMMMSGAALAGGGGHGHGGGPDFDTEILSHNDVGNGPGHDNNDITTNNGHDNNDITTDNGNDGNSWDDSNNTLDLDYTKTYDVDYTRSYDLDITVAKSELDGYISGNTVEYGEAGGMKHRPCGQCAGAGVSVRNSNTLSGFGGASGISTVGQTAGANSMVQQSVVTNASLHTN